ncbi:peroxiredoxin [Chryseobacterium sp. JUb7]|uniref:peroxiredoxin family protein n=1 Tax=Chryseobacterium sp. JUb7 TaxID=2940599 RepID=UPI002167CE72|nr:thioredoxin family protein [Chryseobacterium sp. JUb7]MCS3533093.1 thioredoxin-related protein [Chryseobacterium sp. JUb7]
MIYIKILLIALLTMVGLTVKAQKIEMYFPHFAGKTYDFIIFQGSSTKTVIQDTIPSDGRFTLTIPKENAPYIGMSRWLITGTQQGGGLDMLIPGHDFAVNCTEIIPDNTNIIYIGNTEIPQLNELYTKQQGIFAKYDAMLQARKAFGADDKNYSLFDTEYQKQMKAYEAFQNELKKINNYPAKFTNIVNITQGIGTQIVDSEEQKAKNIAHYIVQNMDWQSLYTSGHWAGIISSWIDVHSMIINDPQKFKEDFLTVSGKIQNPKNYTDFVQAVAGALTRNGKDDLIKMITPVVVKSGKVLSYERASTVYLSGIEGTQAKDLILTEASSKENYKILKSRDFAGKDYTKTLLLFYQSGCGNCETLLTELKKDYEKLMSEKIHIIALSSDTDLSVFKNKAKDFPWKDSYADGEGANGENFKNYGVTGTPTLFLIDQEGKIILRTASLDNILFKLN